MNGERIPERGRFMVRYIRRSRNLYQVIFAILAEHKEETEDTPYLYMNGRRINVSKKVTGAEASISAV